VAAPRRDSQEMDRSQTGLPELQKLRMRDFLIEYAFFARQFVVGNTMSPEVAELFRTRLALAYKMLDEVEKAGNKDPGWWIVATKLGQAQVWSYGGDERDAGGGAPGRTHVLGAGS